MEIRIASLVEGARNAEGTVIVLDIFRAFTTAPIAIKRGARIPRVKTKFDWLTSYLLKVKVMNNSLLFQITKNIYLI